MPALSISGSNLNLRLFNADNEVFAFLDGDQLFKRETEGDPSLQEDHPKHLGKGKHILVVGSVNWGGPAHVRYDLIVDNVVRDPIDERKDSTPNGLWFSRSYEITTH
jgi:hypothetical protein